MGVFIQEPQVGTAHYDLVDAIAQLKRLRDATEQVAILVVGARFKAAYEIYARAAVAGSAGLNCQGVDVGPKVLEFVSCLGI